MPKEDELELIPVAISYMDGVYRYSRRSKPSEHTIDVPESTLRMWDSVTDAYRVMQDQLLLLDNVVTDRRYPNKTKHKNRLMR